MRSWFFYLRILWFFHMSSRFFQKSSLIFQKVQFFLIKKCSFILPKVLSLAFFSLSIQTMLDFLIKQKFSSSFVNFKNCCIVFSETISIFLNQSASSFSWIQNQKGHHDHKYIFHCSHFPPNSYNLWFQHHHLQQFQVFLYPTISSHPRDADLLKKESKNQIKSIFQKNRYHEKSVLKRSISESAQKSRKLRKFCLRMILLRIDFITTFN